MREQVKQEEKQERKCIIRHNSSFRNRWDLFIILVVLYNIIQIPFEIAFAEFYSNKGLEVLGYIFDAVFFIDLILNFRTSYINEKTGLEVDTPKHIAMNYVFHWRFWFDLISTIPFEVLYRLFSGGKSLGNFSFRYFDMLKMFRVLRLGRIITYMKFKQDVKIGFRIFQLLSLLLLLVHWIGCINFVIVSKD